MNKEDIINEYIPFMVRYALKREDAPKDEKELIQFSQALGRELIEQYDQNKKSQEKTPSTSERSASTIIKRM